MRKMKYQRLLSLLLALMMLAPTLLSVGFAEMGEGQQVVEEIVVVEETAAITEAETTSEEDAMDDTPMEIPEESSIDEAVIPEAEASDPVEPSSAPQESVDAFEDIPTEAVPELHPIETAIATTGHAYVWAQTEIIDAVVPIPQGAVLLATAYNDGLVKVWYINGSSEVVSTDVAAVSLALMTNDEAYALADSMLCATIATDTGDWLAFVVNTAQDEQPIEPLTDEEAFMQDEEAVTVEESQPVEESLPEEIIPDQPSIQIGDFVLVTKETRAFRDMEESRFDGYFVRESTVQIEFIQTDDLGNLWYQVRYMYGDDYEDGTVKWTEYGTIYVLADETVLSDVQDFTTITDFAFREKPATPKLRRAARSSYYMPLREVNYGVASLYVGQTWLYGDSGRDSDYPQIAKSYDEGTMYATPHYLDGYIVYCLEHTIPGPGERTSDGGYQPAGPYEVVDINTYRTTPGYSSVMYKDSTLHAIAWVLRHTYPFMVLDRWDEYNDVWSRVAGQFAIRQVIRELEGPQYVRYYWDMDDFYVAEDQAPAEYLEYARWLAEGGIARAYMTGDITVSNKSSTNNGGSVTGTVTLHTDADLLRVSKSVGYVTGNTAGEDGSYHYLNSGDTITATASGSSLTIVAESVSSPEEEANFFIGVTDEPIQKLLIPQYGVPYALDTEVISFEGSAPTPTPTSAILLLKEDDAGHAVAGATFELLDSAGNLLQTKVTDWNGNLTFSDLPAGMYTVRESIPPEGYMFSDITSQIVIVEADVVSKVLFRNNPIQSKIRIVKRDAVTKQPLAGAQFSVNRISGQGSGIVATTVSTGADGVAETGWLAWGKYRVEEIVPPANYVDSDFFTEVEAYEHGKTYTIEVENEPMQGEIQLLKENDKGQALAGATFELLDVTGKVVQTKTTDVNGRITFSALSAGTYTVRETVAPEGYLLSDDAQSVTVQAGVAAQVRFQNAPIQSKIRIVKRDAVTKEPLAGTSFSVNRISGQGSGIVATTISTGADGIAETGLLAWGKYRIEEVRTPANYVDNDYSTEVEAYEHGKTYIVEVENEPMMGHIQLAKTDRSNGNPIEGVQFDIYQDDALVSTMTTDANGIALSDPLTIGHYTVREHGATDGYVLEEIMLDATVKAAETTYLQATNQPVMVKLKLYKRDAEEYTGDPVAAPSTRGDGTLIGAEFQVKAAEAIKDRQGNILHAKGDVIVPLLRTAGEDASVATDILWPGLYEIVELTPPKGYQPSNKAVRVDARDAAKQSQEAIMTFTGVVENKIDYGAFSIVKFLGDNQEHVGSGIVETPEQGAEFEVYLKRAGSYEAAREFERDYLTTNRYGRAKTRALPYGVYVLRQVVGKDGHAMMKPLEIMIDGTEDISDPPSLILNNQAISYRLKIVKKDAETGNVVALAGTSFQLRDADGNLVTQSVTYPTPMEIDTFTTDDNGEVMLPETVPWGHYFITEVKAPDGYLLEAQEVSVFVGHTGDDPEQVSDVVAEVFNTPVKGRILLEKKGLQFAGFETATDDYGNEVHHPVFENGYLEGVTFEIYAAEDIIGKDGTLWFEKDALVETLTTTADGPVMSKELPLGKYVLYETSAPVGYAQNTAPHEVELVYADAYTPVVEARVELTNEYLPAEIALTKHKEALQKVEDGGDAIRQTITTVPGEDFVFGLFNDEGLLVATGATDNEGKLVFAGHYPHGDYSIRELSAPKGWQISKEPFNVTLDPANADESIYIELPTPILNKLVYSNVTLTKTDITGAQTLPGALIEVRNESGEVIYRAYTDGNGQIPDIPVVPGQYTFREVLAPSGYALNTAEMSFTVHDDGSVTGDTTIRDDYTRFMLKKQDTQGNPLAGVAFVLINENGAEITEAVSNEIGIVTFEKIPFGSYTIEEKEPLEGYIKSAIAVDLTVDGTYINPTAPVLIVNIPNHYSFMKVDEEGNPLAGVKFELEDAYGNVVCELVSGEDGMVHVTDLALGSYTIRETEALEGYIRSEDVIELVINETYVVSDELLYMVNHAGIQTGVDIEMTPMMWGGVTLMVVGGFGLLVYNRRRHAKR